MAKPATSLARKTTGAKARKQTKPAREAQKPADRRLPSGPIARLRAERHSGVVSAMSPEALDAFMRYDGPLQHRSK